MSDVDDDADDDDVDDDVDGNTHPGRQRAVRCSSTSSSAVVDEPDARRASTSTSGRRGVAARACASAPGDMGRVIGKRGRVAQAIRTVVRAAAVQDGVEVDVEFVD